MAETTDRLQRFLENELGECRSEDLQQRLDELEAVERAIEPGSVEAELDVLSALANETRYQLVRLLVTAGTELCVCELHPLVDVSESAVSHAMSTLTEAGLVEGWKDGRWKKYRATNRAIALVTVLEGSVSDDE